MSLVSNLTNSITNAIQSGSLRSRLSGFLGGGGRAPVGVDYGSRFAKVAAMSTEGGAPIVTHLVSLGMGQGAFSEGVDPQVVAEEVQGHLDEAGLPVVSAAVAVGGADVQVRRVSMRRASKTEAIRQIPSHPRLGRLVESGKHVFDLEILDPEGTTREMAALVAVAKQDAVRTRQEMTMGAGMHVAHVDVDAFALHNIFAHCARDAARNAGVLVDLGHLSTLVLVLGAEGISTVRTLSVGVDDLTRAISGDGSLLSAEETERDILRQADPAAVYPEAVEAWIARMSKEIRGTVHGSGGRERAMPIGNVAISGGGALIDSVSTGLSSSLGAEVSVFNPLDTLNVRASIPTEDRRAGAQYAVALGLALRQVA